MASHRAALPAAVSLREVGPRDGLQSERPLPPSTRAEFVANLVGAGCRWVEAASFVSPKAVPAMAGAAEVVARARELTKDHPEVTLTALVPNLYGAEAALESGVDELTVTVAASPTYNERNVRRTIDESVTEIGSVVRAAVEAATPVDAVISCAFGSSYEAEIPPASVSELVLRLLESGVGAITLADTTGVATPRTLEDVVGCLERAAPELRPGLHLHETRGTALVNAYAALQLGIDRFDSSVGGLGGSPFAAGAGGNLATEDFVSFLQAMGVETGVDLPALVRVAEQVSSLVGRELPSKVRLPAAPNPSD